MLTRNIPCRRYVLIRVPQCQVHRNELELGVAAAHANALEPTDFELTEKGKRMLASIAANIETFIRGPGFVGPDNAVEIAAPSFWHDGSESAKNALLYMGKAANKWNGTASASKIEPVVIFCSTSTIREFLAPMFDVNTLVCPPLGSVSMFDVHQDPNLRPIVHTIANTSLFSDVVWWNNAP